MYGQYFRLAAEAKAFIPLGRGSELVCRAYLGWILPYNSPEELPLEARLYTGGTNSNRGWQNNTLGPGRYPLDQSSIVPIGGDYKLELNAEYRRDLFNPLELAVFVDAGNVWFAPGSDFPNDQAVLSKESLSLGVAGGIGARFDFNFLILRLDVAQQLFAPDLNRWVVNGVDDIGGERLQFNLGIGYPF